MNVHLVLAAQGFGKSLGRRELYWLGGSMGPRAGSGTIASIRSG
jgi:hypothetical protein